MKKKGLSIASLPQLAQIVQDKLGRYVVILFLLLIVAVYGFVLFRIGALSSAQPDSSAVAAQAKASAVPHIDPVAIKQIQNLQDNSVSVQTLFNQARSNPFQE
jgi:hypothetical protein